MTRDELFASIVAAGPDRDDLVYLQRCGEAERRPPCRCCLQQPAPDLWTSFSAAWPLDGPWLQHYH